MRSAGRAAFAHGVATKGSRRQAARRKTVFDTLAVVMFVLVVYVAVLWSLMLLYGIIPSLFLSLFIVMLYCYCYCYYSFNLLMLLLRQLQSVVLLSLLQLLLLLLSFLVLSLLFKCCCRRCCCGCTAKFRVGVPYI